MGHLLSYLYRGVHLKFIEIRSVGTYNILETKVGILLLLCHLIENMQVNWWEKKTQPLYLTILSLQLPILYFYQLLFPSPQEQRLLICTLLPSFLPVTPAFHQAQVTLCGFVLPTCPFCSTLAHPSCRPHSPPDPKSFPSSSSSSWIPFLLCSGKTKVLFCPLQLPPGTRVGRMQFLLN